MDQRNRTMVLAAVAVLAIALVAVNFDKITGNAVSPTVDITVSPASISSGGELTVLVNPKGNRVKNALEIRKVGGSEVRTYTFDNCQGSWCRDTKAGSVLISTPSTSPDAEGGYYVVVKRYQSGEELGRAYFTVT